MEDEDVISKKKVTYASTPDGIQVMVSTQEDNNLNGNDKMAGKKWSEETGNDLKRDDRSK